MSNTCPLCPSYQSPPHLLTLLMVDTNSVQQHYVFVGHLSHHTGRFKESLPTVKGAVKHAAGASAQIRRSAVKVDFKKVTYENKTERSLPLTKEMSLCP